MKFDIPLLKAAKTPVYYYDMGILDATISAIHRAIGHRPIKVHYALKANNNVPILMRISQASIGADCVSGREIEAAVNAGIAPADICFAGVGKRDDEINLGLKLGIGSFNVESIEELLRIESLANSVHKVANVALRVNPNIDAHTHHYITTGLEENKFGIDMTDLPKAIEIMRKQRNLKLIGLHFHIGSQITTMKPFEVLCQRINGLVDQYSREGIEFSVINVGGGLGIDYDRPMNNPIPDFQSYFDTIANNIKLHPGQEIHCELGRSIVGQCGALISRVLYIKQGVKRKFAILDAGMTDLIRPALYGAYHQIQDLTSDTETETHHETYDIVGPVCESADTFARDVIMPKLHVGDLIAILSAGAYGQSMASQYNMRDLPGAIYK